MHPYALDIVKLRPFSSNALSSPYIISKSCHNYLMAYTRFQCIKVQGGSDIPGCQQTMKFLAYCMQWISLNPLTEESYYIVAKLATCEDCLKILIRILSTLIRIELWEWPASYTCKWILLSDPFQFFLHLEPRSYIRSEHLQRIWHQHGGWRHDFLQFFIPAPRWRSPFPWYPQWQSWGWQGQCLQCQALRQPGLQVWPEFNTQGSHAKFS